MTIRRKYRIISEIGRGGMGVVYRAEHLLFHEERALKVVGAAFAGDPRFASKFLAEVMITRQLQHPNIVRVEDADETEDGQPFAVMEFVHGESLRQVIRREGALEAGRALYIAAQVCAALAAAHQHGIIHRDIKPDNILLVPRLPRSELVKVLDFGIAKVKEEAAISLPDVTSTKTGFFVGTPEYASPEQALGKKGAELDERTDLYSLGIVLYEMLSGDLPFRADTPMGMLLHQIQTPPERPNLELPESVVAVIMRSLAKDSEQRFASAEEMRLALEQAAHELRQVQGVPTPPESPSAETRRQFVATPPSQQARVAAASPGPRSSPVSGPAQLAGTAPQGAVSGWARTASSTEPIPAVDEPPGTLPPQRPYLIGKRNAITLVIAVLCLFGILSTVYVLKIKRGNQLAPPRSEPAIVTKAVEPPPATTAAPEPPKDRGNEKPNEPADEKAKDPAAGKPKQPADPVQPGRERAGPNRDAAAEPAAKNKEAGPLPPPAPAPEPAYVLQLIASDNRKGAEDVLRAVRAAGFQARMVQEPGDPLFRVLVGPFPSRRQADDLRARLEMQGFKPILRH